MFGRTRPVLIRHQSQMPLALHQSDPQNLLSKFYQPIVILYLHSSKVRSISDVSSHEF